MKSEVEATVRKVIGEVTDELLYWFQKQAYPRAPQAEESVKAAPALSKTEFDFGNVADRSRGNSIELNMEEYCQDAVDLYCKTANVAVKSLRKVTTPFCPEGSLSANDEEAKGELSEGACSVLMKALWLARLARPDLNKIIADLATHINTWSRNDDKRVRRLYE